MPTFEPIFEPTHIAPLIDRYTHRAGAREHCHNSTCWKPVEFQVRRPDVYDGLWLQACPVHLASAVRVAGALPRDAQSEVTGRAS